MNARPRIALGALALLAAASLAACSAPEEPEETPAPVPTVPAPAPSTEPEEPQEEPEEEATAPPTCDTLVYADTVTRMTAAGWTLAEDDFPLGPDPVPGGILCAWADYEVASDQGHFFGWAPIEEAAARAAQSYLIGEGWRREDAAAGVYLTEDPGFAITVDEEGYGMTYLFGEGWVLVADVRANLALIEWNG